MPHRERYFFVCTNRRADDDPRGSCAAKGSEALQRRLKALLDQRGLSRRFRACASSCLDMCEAGPAIAVEPDHVVCGGVTDGDLEEIVSAAERGEAPARLVVARSPK